MAHEPKTTVDDSDDESANGHILLAGGVCLFIAGAVVGSMLYALGIAGRHFDVSTLRSGLLTFGIISLAVAIGVVLMTGVIRLLTIFWPRSLTIWSEVQGNRMSPGCLVQSLQCNSLCQEGCFVQ